MIADTTTDLGLSDSDRFAADYLCDSWTDLMMKLEHEKWARNYALRNREPGAGPEEDL